MKPIITAIVLMLLGAGLGLFLYAQVPTTVLTHLVAFGAGIAVGILMVFGFLHIEVDRIWYNKRRS